MTPNEIISIKLTLFQTQILSSEYGIISTIYFIQTSNELKNQTLNLKVSTSPTYLAYIGIIFAFISQWLACIASNIALRLLYEDIGTKKIDIDNAIFFFQTAYLNLYILWIKVDIFRTAFINQNTTEGDFVK